MTCSLSIYRAIIVIRRNVRLLRAHIRNLLDSHYSVEVITTPTPRRRLSALGACALTMYHPRPLYLPLSACSASAMHHFIELPDEVMLHIQSYLPLTTLVRCRGVCRLWRWLIPGSHIPTHRRRLLELYLRAVDSPAFAASRKPLLQHVYPFDREHFLARLHGGVPEDFRTWILEWPGSAVIGSLWPGIRLPRSAYSEPDLLSDRGTSVLSMTILCGLAFKSLPPGTMQTVMFSKPVEGDSGIALLLDDAYVHGWQSSRMLLLSGVCEGTDMSGRIYAIQGVKGRVDKPLATSWTEFLYQELEREEVWLRDRQRECSDYTGRVSQSHDASCRNLLSCLRRTDSDSVATL